MNILKKIIIAGVCLLMLLPVSGAFAATTLSLTNPGDVNLNQQFTIDVKAADTTDLCGASFTISYVPANLEVIDVTSEFFATFQVQFNDQVSPPCSGCPTSVAVGGTTYTQPLEFADSSTGANIGTSIAAARAVPEDPATTDTTIFTVKFQFKAAAAEGGHDIGIKATSLNNTQAGYAGTGEYISLLVGYDGTFSDLLTGDGTGVASTTVNAVKPTWNLDINGDGIVNSSKDGTLITRYLFGWHAVYPGAWAVGLLDPSRDEVAVIAFLDSGKGDLSFDINGDGVVNSSKDGTLIMRYLFGWHAVYPGAWAVGLLDPSRDEATVIAYLNSLRP
ncbi:hypothetical protein QUF76_09950 [Desulfobacterales bacterium HSG16]|nr:hypothetical protein [Desulfobacterales bacterium HSG16]